MARGGKGGHTSHKQPSRPHAGDRRLAGLVRRSVRPGEVPTMGGAASIGRGSGGGGGRKTKGIPLRDISQLRKGRLTPSVTQSEVRGVGRESARLKSVVKLSKIQSKAAARLREDRFKRILPHGQEQKRMSPEKRRSLGRLIRSLSQRFREAVPQTRRK